MKKVILVLLILTTVLGVTAQNRPIMKDVSYTQEWLEVAEFEKKSLPQSASKVVDAILLKAINEKNSPQIIKALIHQGKYQISIDNQNDTTIFLNLNQMLEKSSDEIEKSVIHSMLGELYLQYYQKEQWTINQRTELGDFVPSDMKEWTKNTFYNKVVEHLSASLSNENLLINTKVEDYAAVIELGKDSRKYYPTMFDFLSLRAIEVFASLESDEDLSKTLARKGIPQKSLFASAEEFVKIDFNIIPSDYNLWVYETYRNLLSSLLDRGNKGAVLLTELNLLEKLSVLNNSNSENTKSQLTKLLQKWEEDSLSVEVIDKLANIYQNEIYSIEESDSLLKATKTKELYELLVNSIRKFPEYSRISILENRVSSMTQPQFNITGNKTFPIKADKVLTISFRNIKSLNAKLYRINSPIVVQMAQMRSSYEINNKRIFIKDINIPIPKSEEYLFNDTTFTIGVDVPGIYMLEFDSTPKLESYGINANYFFTVSDLAAFSRLSSKDKYDLFVVDRVTGKPVRNAKVNIYKLPGNWRDTKLTLVETLTTNTSGLAVYHKNIPNNDVFYNVESGNDNSLMLSRLPYAYYNMSNNQDVDRESTHIFTDRSLYRPGQTVFFKAISTQSNNNEHLLQTQKSVEFILRDANSREISKQTLTTNEYGSVSGEFVIPQGTLPGSFTIETKNGSANFQVEEYKRPTFEVTFEKIDKTYKFGEEITLIGKAESFSGIKLQNALVEWTITRQQAWWWRWGGSAEHYTQGSATTDEDGNFNITFTPEKSDNQTSLRSVLSFNVEAVVTDINGETQVANYSVTVGDISMILLIQMPSLFEKNSDDEIIISAQNLDGANIDASGIYTIYSLHENDSINNQVSQGEFKTGNQDEIKRVVAKLESGKYRLKLTSEDDRGNAIEAQNDFVVFSYGDKRPPIKTNDWFIIKSNSYSKDKAAEVILGASERVNVLYELWQENNLLERRWIELNNENKLFSFPYKEEYKNGVSLMLTYIKDQKFYSHKAELRPKKEQDEIKVKLDVFRDKIIPGGKEEWRISITDTLGNPRAAEVLASMYDFSLDNIYPSHPWNLSLYNFDRYISMRMLTIDLSFNKENANAYYPISFKEVTSFEYDRFNWFGFSFYSGQGIMIRGTRSLDASADNIVVGYAQLNKAEVATESSMAPPPAPSNAKLDNQVDSQAGSQTQAPQIRRNFNETAFFYPQLRTNDKGETQIVFDVPENNTRWRFRVLAHDKKLNYATAEAFTVSQKKLMITPNMPRFLRQGDRVSISTKISNLSDSVQQGKVRMEFFNPVTDEIIDNILLDNIEQSFTLNPAASTDANWMFDVPDNIDVIGIRIIAQSNLFSDGEQHALAILPNRMLVTESMRMDLNGDETKTFNFDKLNSNSLTQENYRLTLEFTSNPAWYAVQALTVLGEPTSDNAVSWFAAFYANSIGAHIGKAYPRVSALIDSWKKQGGNEETLLSNLEKNEELKNILLQETPWVLDAKNETEQKEKLSLLFDLNRNRNITQTALLRLQDLQTTEGGWSWFKGFRPSISITQYILYGFNQLTGLNIDIDSDQVNSMKLNAIKYIDAEAIRRFESLKKYNKDWKNIKSISTTDLEYLFVRSSYNQHQMDKEVSELYNFYLSVVEKNWTSYGLYERSLIARLMNKKNNTRVLQDIIKSYREHSVVSDEMGMYWPNNRANVFMSQSSISVHTFIMDAFKIGGATNDEIDNLKKWLLKQKQTQLWESTHATADAVYALLSSGSDWFSVDGTTKVTLGNKLVEPKSSELGTGYFKEAWSRTEISPDMANVSVTHKGNSPSWGALYLQYFEDMDKIQKSDGSLDIEKMMFVEVTTPEGQRLMSISEERSLKVGDKVTVRLTVRSDRDMEFIHLKDLRASSFEPVNQVSGLKWQNGLMYYQTSTDASTNFYFDNLPKGTYVLEYSVYVTRKGNYSSGIATILSMYAPEFTSHTEGNRVEVTD
ncbi:MAG: hypothetical protein ITF98_03200 [Fermentimonas sp.]|nr:hypothetical protein [Fermentimonas sp.]